METLSQSSNIDQVDESIAYTHNMYHHQRIIYDPYFNNSYEESSDESISEIYDSQGSTIIISSDDDYADQYVNCDYSEQFDYIELHDNDQYFPDIEHNFGEIEDFNVFDETEDFNVLNDTEDFNVFNDTADFNIFDDNVEFNIFDDTNDFVQIDISEEEVNVL